MNLAAQTPPAAPRAGANRVRGSSSWTTSSTLPDTEPQAAREPAPPPSGHGYAMSDSRDIGNDPGYGHTRRRANNATRRPPAAPQTAAGGPGARQHVNLAAKDATGSSTAVGHRVHPGVLRHDLAVLAAGCAAAAEGIDTAKHPRPITAGWAAARRGCPQMNASASFSPDWGILPELRKEPGIGCFCGAECPGRLEHFVSVLAGIPRGTPDGTGVRTVASVT